MEKIGTLYERYIRGKVNFISLVALVISMVVVSNSSPQSIIYSLAVGFIPACIVGLLWDFALKKEFLAYVRQGIAEETKELVDSNLAAVSKNGELMLKQCELNYVFDKLGISNVSFSRQEANLGSLFRGAEKRIWVLVTSFSYLTETAELLDVLASKALNGLEVRILGLAPDTSSSALRSAFSLDYASLNTEIPLFIDKLKSRFTPLLSEPLANNWAIHIYDKIPTCALFIADSKIVACTLLCSQRGRNGIHFTVDKNGLLGSPSRLFDQYEQHFEKLFRESIPVLSATSGVKP